MPVYVPGQAAADRLDKLPGRVTADRVEKLDKLRRLGHSDATQRLSPATEFMSSTERDAYQAGYAQSTQERATKEREAAMARRASQHEKSVWQSGFRDGARDGAAAKRALFGSHDPADLELYRSGYVAGAAARAQRIAAGPPLTQSWGNAFTHNYPTRSSRASVGTGSLGSLLDTIQKYGPTRRAS
jgi:hypothetical protein